VKADGETTSVEDWFTAQGHSGYRKDEKISLRQAMKNAYVEVKWGFKYWNFPWKLESQLSKVKIP
jgi:hypothetical protein